MGRIGNALVTATAPAKPALYLTLGRGPKPIPEVRDALAQLSDDLAYGRVSMAVAAQALTGIVENLKRKPPVRVTRKKLKPLTEKQKSDIRYWARNRPDLSQLDLAMQFNTNPGRISEALNEKAQ